MAESSVNVTEGSGKRLHTWDNTISSVLVQDQFMLPGEYPLASYILQTTSSSSTATTDTHLLQLMAGSSLKVRIRRIVVEQAANATTGAPGVFNVFRLTTAGTGGSALTPRPHDPASAAAGATGMAVPSSKGTEGVQLLRGVILLRQTVATSGAQQNDRWVWEQHPGMSPIIIASGTSNGIVVKNEAAYAGASVNVTIEFVETSF